MKAFILPFFQLKRAHKAKKKVRETCLGAFLLPPTSRIAFDLWVCRQPTPMTRASTSVRPENCFKAPCWSLADVEMRCISGMIAQWNCGAVGRSTSRPNFNVLIQSRPRVEVIHSHAVSLAQLCDFGDAITVPAPRKQRQMELLHEPKSRISNACHWPWPPGIL
jgi:hypothetical protein